MNLKIQVSSFDRVYFHSVTRTEYASLLDLILELFYEYTFADRSEELYLYQLLSDLGYRSIDDIPIPELALIVEYFEANRDSFKSKMDEEKMTYLLLAAIQKEEVIVLLDNKIIEDLKSPLKLNQDSTLVFFKQEKLNRITFKTI